MQTHGVRIIAKTWSSDTSGIFNYTLGCTPGDFNFPLWSVPANAFHLGWKRHLQKGQKQKKLLFRKTGGRQR
jgi:hypothetical protein